jgi:transaldolase
MSTQPANRSNPLRELAALGQSVWLDDLHRGMLNDGTLARLIDEDGLAGLTSNPTILTGAFRQRPEYAEDIERLLRTEASSIAIYEALAFEDVGRAADAFRDLYRRTEGRHGFVSIEVSPLLADDTAGTIEEAKRLWRQLARPNVMIKVPGTEAGLPAIRVLIGAGVNVNVTLLFSPQRYRAVAEQFFAGLEDRVAGGEPVGGVASVASFFLSRIDTLLDKRLDALAQSGEIAARALRGKSAVACAARAYEIYGELIGSERWQALAERGARSQRLLWASTSTKDPHYPPTKYVDELVAAETVNTMPFETLVTYRERGRPALTLEHHLAEASDTRESLERLGIDLEEAAAQLEREGVRKFLEPFQALQRWLGSRGGN